MTLFNDWGSLSNNRAGDIARSRALEQAALLLGVDAHTLPADVLLTAMLAEMAASTMRQTRIVKVPFTFDTPGLLAGTKEVYTPKIGELLLDLWFEVTESWDGGGAFADVGQFPAGDLTGVLHGGSSDGYDLSATDQLSEGGGILRGPFGNQGSAIQNSVTYGRLAPAKFESAEPLCVCVSGTGAPGGPDPASTKGSAILHLVIGAGEEGFSVPEGTVAQLGVQIATELSAVRAIIAAALADATAQQRLSARFAEVGSAHVSKTGDETIELLAAKPYPRLITSIRAVATEAFADNSGTQTSLLVSDEDDLVGGYFGSGEMTGQTVDSGAATVSGFDGSGRYSSGLLRAGKALNIYKTGATGDGTGECDLVVQAVALL